jgi:hypothetical protein
VSGDSILDDLFHGCALSAFVEQALRQGAWPDPEATRRAAYDLYERALAKKNAHGTGGRLPTSPFTSDVDSGMVGDEPTQMGGKEVPHARSGNR